MSEQSPSSNELQIALERPIAQRFSARALAKSAAGNAALMLLLFMSGAALANDAALLRCRGIADASARLACYDALVLTATGGRGGEAAQGKPDQPRSRAEAQSPQQQATEQFGMERRASKDTLETIESHIPGSFEGWEPRTKIVLANGQVWQISDDSVRAHYIDNAKIRIRRGAFGAFYLEIEGTNSSPRVKRLQ